MTDQEQLLDTVAELSHVLLAEETVQTTLQRVVELAREAIEHCDGVGITLVGNGRPTTTASTDAFVLEVDRAQYRAGDGPCLCAFDTGRPVLVASTADDDRWPAFSLAALSEGVASSLSLPLIAGEATVGALNVYSRTTGGLDDAGERAAASMFAEHAAVALANAQAFESERSLAVAIQRSLLPNRLPDVPGVAIAARYLPAGVQARVGGDWYDAFRLDADRLAVVVGDVVGHDVEAAAMMGQLRTGLRAYALEGHGPAAALERLSALLEATQDVLDLQFATVCLLVLHPKTGLVTYANAGHLPPLIVSAEGSVRFLDAESSVFVGVPSHRTEASVMLRPGDAVLLYTDGLVERRERSLDEGLRCLAEAAAEWTQGGPDELCDLVIDRLLCPAGSDDDVAALALELTPGRRS